MVFCSICGVHFRHKSDGIRFHRLPKNTIRRKQWLAAIEKKIKNFAYTKNSVICSKHFAEDCFVKTGCGKLYLKPNTIPTVFDMPLRKRYNSTQVGQQTQQQYTCDTNASITEESGINSISEQCIESLEQSLSGTSIQTTENRMNLEEIHVSIPKVQRTTKLGFVGSTNVDISNPYKDPLYKLKIQEKEIKRLKAKLKIHRQKCRRLHKKVLSLTSLVKHLKDKKLLSEDAAKLLQKIQEKKKATWDVKETECFLTIIKELQVTTLMDEKKFRTSEIFKNVEETFKSKGYNKTHTQLLDKFKAMKKRFEATIGALSISDVGTEVKCHFFEELSEIFGLRPIVNQSDIDSTILPTDPNDEASGYCASDTEIFVSKDCGESQTEKCMERTSSRCSLSPITSIRHERSSSDTLHSSFLSSPSISNCLSENSRDTSTPPFNSHELDDSDKPCTSASKKRKICETPTFLSRKDPRSGLKNTMQNFAEQIIESQEKLLAKAIEEQHKLDKEMFNQYNNMFLQQTQMLLTGLQNLSSPFPKNDATLQQFSGVSTMPPMNPMFTETSLHQPYPTVLHENNKNTTHPYTSHETQTRQKSNQTEKAISKFTTIPSSNSIRLKTIHPPVQNSSTLLHTSTTSQSETLSSRVLEEDEDTQYENIEYIDYVEND